MSETAERSGHSLSGASTSENCPELRREILKQIDRFLTCILRDLRVVRLPQSIE
jgi:hypothetical protein